jgi:hypothetical protein
LIRREIQETREALEAFNAAVEAGEVAGFKDGMMVKPCTPRLATP